MKRSLVMVEPKMPLKNLAPFELEIFERVIFQYFDGLNADHTKRWQRWWRWVFHTGARMIFYPVVDRSAKFHAMHMAIEGRVFEHQDGFLSKRAFRLWLKTGAAFGNFESSGVGLVFVPSSLSWEDCSDDEMREVHEDIIEFLRTPIALKTLWPDMRPADRLETLESLLRSPNDRHEDHH